MKWLGIGLLLAFVVYLLDRAKGSTQTAQVSTTFLTGNVSGISGAVPTDATTGLPRVNVSALAGIKPGYALQTPVLDMMSGQYMCGQSGYYPVVDSSTGAMVCVPGSSLGIQ